MTKQCVVQTIEKCLSLGVLTNQKCLSKGSQPMRSVCPRGSQPMRSICPRWSLSLWSELNPLSQCRKSNGKKHIPALQKRPSASNKLVTPTFCPDVTMCVLHTTCIWCMCATHVTNYRGTHTRSILLCV